MNTLDQKVFDYIEHNHLIEEGDTVIIGLSGGADSVCLLNLLSKYKILKNISLVAVHVNHMIRGEEAKRDEKFAKSLCDKMQIKCEIFCKNIPEEASRSGESEEECGRRIRYEIFKQVMEKYQASKIAVAHHMNDQAETVLFRIARGSGVKGIAGMRASHGNIIRPLLCISKDEIVEYIRQEGLDYVEDYTNDDTEYSRNYIRKEILPKLEIINSDAINHIASLADLAGEMNDYICKKAKEIVKKAQIRTEDGSTWALRPVYDVNIIRGEDDFLLPYVIRSIFDENNISLKDITRDHVLGIAGIMRQCESKRLELPRGIRFCVEANKAYILTEGENIDRGGQIDELEIGPGEYTLSDGSKLLCRLLESFSMEDIPRNAYTKWFDYDKICNGLCIRNRLPGDTIVVNEAGDHKKLKEYFINEKIPQSERDSVKVIVAGSEVIWVIGHRIAENVKLTSSTETVLEINYII